MLGHTPDWLQEIRDYWSQLIHEQHGAAQVPAARCESETVSETVTQAMPGMAVTHTDNLKL